MSLGQLGLLPSELIRQICYHLSLDDILSFQKTHSFIEMMVDNVFFADMRLMEVKSDAQGTVVSLSAPSTSTQFCTTAANNWKETLYKSKRVSKLSLRRTDDAKESYVLDVIERAEFHLLDLEFVLLPATDTSQQHSRSRIYRVIRLTEFMLSCSRTLNRFRLEAGPSNCVEYLLDGTNATLNYSQDDVSYLQQHLIIPLFHALSEGRQSPLTLTLRIGWREKPMMALQAAFHAALPRSQRSKLRALKLDFGNDISTLSNEEIQQIIAQYAPYLNETRQLRHLILDLSHSKLLASELEKLYMIISLELSQTHRISLYTSECLPEAKFADKQKPFNRVACS